MMVQRWKSNLEALGMNPMGQRRRSQSSWVCVTGGLPFPAKDGTISGVELRELLSSLNWRRFLLLCTLGRSLAWGGGS